MKPSECATCSYTENLHHLQSSADRGVFKGTTCNRSMNNHFVSKILPEGYIWLKQTDCNNDLLYFQEGIYCSNDKKICLLCFM
jgi:hypothetical protein